jgi:hypothetical protein
MSGFAGQPGARLARLVAGCPLGRAGDLRCNSEAAAPGRGFGRDPGTPYLKVLVNARHDEAESWSLAPSRRFESRTAIRAPKLAASTQFPLSVWL